MTPIFADAHAILAFLAGDEAVSRRLRGGNVRTGLLNVGEARYAQLAADVAPAEVDANLSPFEALAVAPDVDDVHDAASRRHAERQRGNALSFVDALGYAQARRLDAPFVTTLPAFKGVAGAEVVGEAAGRR